MKYFKCHASASFVGTDETWKIKADSEKEAMELFSDTAIQHIDSYEEPEEDSEIEREYDYYVIEISEEQFNDLKVDDLS